MTQVRVPTFEQLMNPILQALKELGGSGTIEEINNKATGIANIPDEQLEVLHNPEKGSQTEVEYRLAWARTYLKKYGMVENSSRGVWALTPKGRQTDRVNPQAVRRSVQEKDRKTRETSGESETNGSEEEITWRDGLLATLQELGLGVKMERIEVERVSVDDEWFQNI
jgi:restriction system protein